MKNISLYEILFEAQALLAPLYSPESYEREVQSRGLKQDPKPEVTNVQELNVVNSGRADLARKIETARRLLGNIHRNLGNPKSIPDYNKFNAAYEEMVNDPLAKSVISQEFINLVKTLLAMIEHRQPEKSKRMQN